MPWREETIIILPLYRGRRSERSRIWRWKRLLKDSYDWLEELKGNDLLLFLRPHDPCWNDEDYSALCIDDLFLDEEGYYCDDYEEADEDECKAKDIFTGKPASEKCCGCGGGRKLGEAHEEL